MAAAAYSSSRSPRSPRLPRQDRNSLPDGVSGVGVFILSGKAQWLPETDLDRPAARPPGAQRVPGITRSMPLRCTGTTGTPNSTASRPMPRLNRRIEPSPERLPSGKLQRSCGRLGARGLALSDHPPGDQPPPRRIACRGAPTGSGRDRESVAQQDRGQSNLKRCTWPRWSSTWSEAAVARRRRHRHGRATITAGLSSAEAQQLWFAAKMTGPGMPRRCSRPHTWRLDRTASSG